MRIACWGYYGKNNLGDDLILSSLLEHLTQADSNQIVIFSASDEVKRFAPSGMEIQVAPRGLKNLLSESRKADLMIFGPGGIMPQRSTGKLLFWLLLILILKIRRAQVAFIGLGIGQQNFEHRIDRLLLKTIIRVSDGFVVRQKGVREALHYSWEDTNQLVEAADVVFTQSISEKKQGPSQCRSVVFSLAYIFEGTAENELQRLTDGISKSVDSLVREGYQIHFVEFTKGNDMVLYEDILKKIQVPSAVVIHRYEDGVDSVIRVFQNAEFSICMRFHALVLSALAATPCCVIAYSDKMDDIARRLGLEPYLMRICPIDTLYYQEKIPFDTERFEWILDDVKTNQATIRLSLERKRVTIQQEAEQNWAVLFKLFNKRVK